MTDPSYDRIFTESELRRRIDADEIAAAITGRLRDDGLFDPVNWQIPYELRPDGSFEITEDGLAFLREQFNNHAAVLIHETMNALMEAMFRDDPEAPA